MDSSTEESPPIAARRPILVWIISAYKGYYAAYTIFTFVRILSGAMPLDTPVKQAMASHPAGDYIVTLLLAVCSLVGAILLLLLKKRAFYVLSGGFCAELGLFVYVIIARNLLGAVSGPILTRALISWGIELAILLYCKRLIGRGILK